MVLEKIKMFNITLCFSRYNLLLDTVIIIFNGNVLTTFNSVHAKSQVIELPCVGVYKSVRRAIQDKNLITLNSPQKGASACKFMVCRNGNSISPVNRLKVVQFEINLLYFLDSLD